VAEGIEDILAFLKDKGKEKEEWRDLHKLLDQTGP